MDLSDSALPLLNVTAADVGSDQKGCELNNVKFITETVDETIHQEEIAVVDVEVASEGSSTNVKVENDGMEIVMQVSCKTCGKKVTTKRQLYDHIRVSHHKPSNCITCGKAFQSRKLLLAHVNEIHNEKSNLCDFCGKIFKKI